MAIVAVKKIVKRFGDITAVDHVDLTIQEGEIYGLLGPNGAGKSTMINILCDMVKRDSGDLWLFGHKVNKIGKKEKEEIGVVPQNIAIYDDLTAKENVMFFGSLYGLKGDLLKERTLEALAFVGLLDQQKKLPKTFSGGMKRRLNIACAIVHHPKLIIMDEPTVGIDTQSRNQILNAVKKLNSKGSTIIYTTHYMEEAEHLCTRIGIMDHGKVIAEGTCEELQSIVTDRKSIVIQTGIDQVIKPESLKSIRGVLHVTIDEHVVTIECPKESDCITDVLAYFAQQKIVIRDIKMQGVSLETAFLSLTGRRLSD
ncbi:ABC transporter ATP-binding protein [Vallitalea pronyensis]|uniref:ABC transporter ATP-binding protein n=1 Tax=Vallitalea pronyensis TaxID=1348613 RepID=A0A8J8MJB7_9FIRM|nr:ABC transporter ATP-binding protein [Vallitalea pronyensis]QUI22501.1 ABC transporter ATP-binding protein [Vallitalea pronyensis]